MQMSNMTTFSFVMNLSILMNSNFKKFNKYKSTPSHDPPCRPGLLLLDAARVDKLMVRRVQNSNLSRMNRKRSGSRIKIHEGL